MESAASTWPYVIGACLIGLGLIATGLIGLPVALPTLDFSLLSKTTGILPSAILRYFAAGLFLAILALSLCFWWSVKLITDDYADRVSEAKSKALPPAVLGSITLEEKVACAVEHYRNSGFAEASKFLGDEGREITLMRKFEHDRNQIWRAEGVLVYPEGTSTQFSVGVVYGEGAWIEGSTRKVQRRGMLRQVHIETVLKAQELRDLADTNDYLLTLGVASNSENEDSDKNWRLSLARAHNLGVAALRLGWKPADRIWPQTIGYSKTIAATAAVAQQQRPVILIGVVANRIVRISDVTVGAMKIVPIDRVNLAGYSVPIDEPREPRRISSRSLYLDEKDMNPQPSSYQVRSLAAISNEQTPATPESTQCQ